MNRWLKYKLDHALFWALTIFFHGYTRLSLIEKAGFGQFLLELIIRNSLLACAVYLTLSIAIPRFTKGKSISMGLLILVASLLLYVVGKNAHDVYLYGYVIGDPVRQNFFHNSLYNAAIVLFYLAFGSALYLSRQWYQQRQLIQEIELEKLTAELAYLRAQINPHFLFNAINSIYFQIDKQNLVARNTLTQFSDLLRYQLYECNGHSIAIEKEIQYLTNYIKLQQLRKGENYTIDFAKGVDLAGFGVPPLLLIPFVENAFKHVSGFADRENVIKITIEKTGMMLKVYVYNTKDDTSPCETGGIGLKNARRRLDLLYGKAYKLHIENNADDFSVNLQLPLA